MSPSPTSSRPSARAGSSVSAPRASRPYTDVRYQDGDWLLFGGETYGLPPEVLARYAEQTFAIPMPAGKVRSLNLATAVGIVLYEALRQLAAW